MTTTNDTTVLETPKPMIPANATVAEHGVGLEFDIIEYARGIAKGKKDTGTLSFTRGNGLFNSVCQGVKSKRGIKPSDRLPADVATKIRDAVDIVMNEAIGLVTELNLSSVSRRAVIRGNAYAEKVSVIGINPLSYKDQIFIAKMRKIELEAKKAKVELAYGDTTALDKALSKNSDILILASARNEEKVG